MPDFTYRFVDLCYGFLRANHGTEPAPVAKIVHLRRGFPEHGQCTKLAGRDTLAAPGAAIFIDGGYPQGNEGGLKRVCVEEKAEIRFLYVGVDGQKPGDGCNKGCADTAFPRASLAACHR
jgi:hypothetical protein